jgi:hypothetical protein
VLDKVKGEKRKKGIMNNPKTLNLIRKILIAGVGLLVIILVILLLFSSTKTNSDTVDIGPKPGDPFFESPAVYYLKAAGSNQVFPSVIHLMKTLKMDDKEAAETEFKKLNLNESKGNQDNKQYFFYKASDQVVHTFAISFKARDVEPKPIRVKIKILEGENPNKFLAIYLLEKKQDINNSDVFLYTIDYLEGKYDYRSKRSISYKYLEKKISDGSPDEIIGSLAYAIQETINKNPRETAKNGPNLIFIMNLLGDNDQEIGTPLYISFPLVNRSEGLNIFNKTYVIKDARKASLENELKSKLIKLFSTIENRDEVRRQIEIFKNNESISDSSYWLQDKTAGRIKAAIFDFDIRSDSFRDWKKAFDSKGTGVPLIDMKTYIEERLSQKKAQQNEGHKSPSYVRKMIYIAIGIGIMVLLGIYFWLGHKLKKPFIHEIIEQQGLLEPLYSAEKCYPADLESEKVASTVRSIEVDSRPILAKDKKDDTADQKSPGVSKQVDIEKYPSIEEIKEKLKKIGKLVNKLKIDLYSQSSAVIATELQDNFRCAESTITEMLDANTIDSEFLISGVRKIRENLKNIEKDRIMVFFTDELKNIETGLIYLEKYGLPKQVEWGKKGDFFVIPLPSTYLTAKEQHIIKTKADIQPFEKDSNETLRILKGLEKFWGNLQKSLFRGKEETEIVAFVADTLKTPAENKTLIAGNRDLLNEIKGTLSQLGDTVNHIAKESQNEAIFYRMLQYINRDTDLKVNEKDKNNVVEIIDKVSNESIPSKKYRACAVGLYKESLELEEKYNQKWFWKLLDDSFLGRLKEDGGFFAINNGSGKTIYDRYLGKEIPLREIKAEHIKKILESNHWTKIWDGVIRMSDFFNAYFDNDMDDIKFALGNYSQKMKKILIELGYSIEERIPLSLISTEYRKKKDFELIDKTYIEKFVLKELKESENKQFKEAMLNIPYGEERVIYVDRLGLTDKFVEPNIAITKLRFAAYNQGILQARFSSKPRTTEPDELGD